MRVVLPGGRGAALAASAEAQEFVRLQFRHCKPMLLARRPTHCCKRPGSRRRPTLPGCAWRATRASRMPARSSPRSVAGPRAWERQTDPPPA